MDQAFDPYRKWLGIPAVERPANCYRLLGIDVFEADPDVISNAADGRMAQVKSFSAGKYAADSQRILNEIAAAKICLLDQGKKALYDRKLRQQLAPAGVTTAAKETGNMDALDFTATTLKTHRAPARPAKAKARPWTIYAAAAGGVALLGAVALFFILHNTSGADERLEALNRSTASGATKAEPATAEPESPVKAEPKTPPAAVVKPDVKLPSEPPKAEPDRNKPALELVATSDNEAKLRPLPGASEDPGETQTASLSPAGNGAEAPAESKTDEKDPAASDQDDAQPAEPVAKVKRVPVPDKPRQAPAEAKVREIFKQEYAAAKSSEARADLCKKLVDEADASKDDATVRYVLLRLAGEQAVLGADAAQAMAIVDKLQESYAVDGANMKADVLAAIARQPGSDGASAEIVNTAMALCEEAISRDDFELAGRFVKTAAATARKTRDLEQSRQVLARTHEIERLKNKYVAVQKALDTLQTDAADGAANVAAGQWYCFVKGNWSKGLPMLAKGDRADLADLAKRDLAKPKAAKEQAAVGDGWWALAEKDSGLSKQELEARARHWYELAQPRLTGLDKAQVDKRLEVVPTASEPAPAAALRGAIHEGNVALASNGAVAEGPGIPGRTVSCLNDGNSTHYDGTSGHTAAKWPCEWIVTLSKVYRLQEIRIKLWDLDNRDYKYLLAVSGDGKTYKVIADRSQGERGGWKDFRFPPRSVKAIKLIAIQTNGNELFGVVELEAYCKPIIARN